jgi:hypothetical protein
MNRYAFDTFYMQGTTHSVCQDYALGGIADGYPYAIVTDGCSGSRDTDTGARILARCAASLVALLDNKDPDMAAKNFGNLTIRLSREFLLPGLDKSALDATLIVCVALADRFRVLAFGDGVIFASAKQLNAIIEFTHSAPFYLNYLEDEERLLAYRKIGPRVRVNDGEFKNPEDRPLLFDFLYAETDRVGIGSDGWLTFTNEHGSVVPVSDLETELLAFKTTAGAFVQRRVRNGLVKKLQKNGFSAADDISFAALVKE